MHYLRVTSQVLGKEGSPWIWSEELLEIYHRASCNLLIESYLPAATRFKELILNGATNEKKTGVKHLVSCS